MPRFVSLPLWIVLGCSGGVDLSGDGGDAEPETPADSIEAEADAVDLVDPGADETAPDDVAPTDEFPDDAPGEEVAPEECLAQDARPEGECEMELPGIVWNGTSCVHLGTGCRCVGADCDGLYDTIAECVAARLACYGDVCAPQAAAGRMCGGGGCATFLGVFWDGRECFALTNCECVGDGCARPFASLEECAAAHARCDGALCRATGGDWFPAAAGFCGFSCGAPNECTLESPIDSCRCADGRTFISGSGCMTEGVGCEASFLCRQTGGTWHGDECACPYRCGVPFDECAVCGEQCDCGPYANFDGDLGCVPDAACPGADRQALCTSTGGTWHDCGSGDWGCACGDYVCGAPSPLACVAPGCDCGGLRNFDAVLGCVLDDACVLQTEGESCRGTFCRPGLVCCEACGAPPGCASCRAPCCDDEPGCLPGGCPPPPP